jgi:UDP-glucuronate decarboxylase
MDFMRQNGTKVKIVRIFNTYGPRMDKNDGRVVSNFIAQALEGRPLTVYGRGRQTRSFQYIDDLILGLVKMMGKKGFAGPVNLGSPKEFTVLDLAKKVIKLTNSKSSIVYRALPEDDPKQRKPAVGLAQKVLKWRPKIKLFEGLTKTISYYRNGK